MGTGRCGAVVIKLPATDKNTLLILTTISKGTNLTVQLAAQTGEAAAVEVCNLIC